MLYNREPVLPIDVKYGLDPDGPNNDEPFDLKTFLRYLRSHLIHAGGGTRQSRAKYTASPG